MKKALLILFALFCLYRIADAATLTLSWDGGPIVHPAANRTRAEGTIATVVATATGFDQPVVAFAVNIEILSLYDGMPDAWRFDTGGCAQGGFETPEVAIDPTCPFLSLPNPRSIRGISLTSGYWAREACYFGHTGDAMAVSPTARYTIAQFRFDMSKGFAGLGLRPDGCGCVDQPQAIHIRTASWLGADGIEREFDKTNLCLGWEDPNNSIGCPNFSNCDVICDPYPPPRPKNPCADQQPTPAEVRSWGAVKAFYR